MGNSLNPDVGTRRARVLARLKAASGSWLDGSDLANEEVGGSEGLRRLRELRADGWQIEERAHPDASRTGHQYRLVGKMNIEAIPIPAAVSVAPSAPQGTSEGLFEVIEEPVVPALRPSDYACSKVITQNKVKTPCLLPLTHIFETRMDSRFVEGSCPSHGRVVGSLIKGKQPPVGWGRSAVPAPKTTKARAYRKRKSR